jgi:hypothetical protein
VFEQWLMDAGRCAVSGGWGGIRRLSGIGAVAAAVLAAVLADGSWAEAAPGAGPVTAGIISTVVGGVGGPGKATAVSLLGPFGVAYDARTGDL